jgi:hypothetical protein
MHLTKGVHKRPISFSSIYHAKECIYEVRNHGCDSVPHINILIEIQSRRELCRGLFLFPSGSEWIIRSSIRTPLTPRSINEKNSEKLLHLCGKCQSVAVDHTPCLFFKIEFRHSLESTEPLIVIESNYNERIKDLTANK